jgi:uncharacterized repeat protein (TIGR01451 family)
MPKLNSTTISKICSNSSKATKLRLLSILLFLLGGLGLFGSLLTPALAQVAFTADLAITKTRAPGTLVAGETIIYILTVTNNGPDDVIAARVIDALPVQIVSANWSCTATIGSSCPASGTDSLNIDVNLLNGGTVTFTITGTIDSGASGSITNDAAVAAPASVTDPNIANNTTSDTTPNLTFLADLVLTKTHNFAEIRPGDPLIYTLTVTNPGPSDSNGATLTDNFPGVLSGISWTCSATTGSSCGTAAGSRAINNAVLNLRKGGKVTFTVNTTVAATATGTITNSASVTPPASVPDPDLTNNQATDLTILGPVADLGVTLQVDNATVPVSQLIIITARVTNLGPSPATGAEVTLPLPSSLSYSAQSLTNGTYSPATGQWNVGNLAFGQTATLQLTVKPTAVGLLLLTVTKTKQLEPDPTLTNNTASVTLNIFNKSDDKGGRKVLPADLVAQLRVTPDRLASLDPAELITYTLTVKNIGPGTASHITVRFPLDPALELGFASFDNPQVWVSAVVTSGVKQPYVQISIPDLETHNQPITAQLVFNASNQANAGSTVFSRYLVYWDDEEAAGKQRGSNAELYAFSEDNTIHNDTNGEVQFFTPTRATISSSHPITLTANFYAPDELVSFWYTDQEGKSIALGTKQADNEGKLNFEVPAEILTTNQTYIIAGFGNRSGMTGSAILVFGY